LVESQVSTMKSDLKSTNKKVLWVYGPNPAGENDITIFRKKLKVRFQLESG
jgi:hypothetical protein